MLNIKTGFEFHDVANECNPSSECEFNVEFDLGVELGFN